MAIGGAVTMFLLTGLAAGYVPAQKNARLHPMQILRRQ
jgi:ABC-type antimicrobial peptide transport system permease subunit